MKKVFLGMGIGIILCGAAGFLVVPKVQQEGYTNGYAIGSKEGREEGMKAGIAQGVAELKAMQKHEQDSLANERIKQEERMRAARAKRKPAPAPIQNWHVIDGKIGDPVVADNRTEAKPDGIQ